MKKDYQEIGLNCGVGIWLKGVAVWRTLKRVQGDRVYDTYLEELFGCCNRLPLRKQRILYVKKTLSADSGKYCQLLFVFTCMFSGKNTLTCCPDFRKMIQDWI